MPPAATPTAASRAPSGARCVGGYHLVGLIGSGSIGDVHLALPPDGGACVALKLLRAVPGAAADEAAEARRRFIGEGETARRLLHPDIVRVLACGDDGGTAWIAMELLGGCDLVRYTRAARLLPEPVVLRIAERLAAALAHAHGRGVVHRDVKPANVIVDWATDRVTLTDFGLARPADAEATRTGLVLGSPAYLAPEQLAGAPAAPAGDLYALGVTLFQLLAGRLPFDAASMGDLLRQVATAPPPPLAALRPDLPPAQAAALGALLERLLAKRPAQRPADAATLAAELAALRARL